ASLIINADNALKALISNEVSAFCHLHHQSL
ncbi:hypothetical protein D046_7040B, partial [Vibrio parahaemolyticus V-223/04]